VSDPTPPAPPAKPKDRDAAPLLRGTSALRGVMFVAANMIAFLALNAFLHYLTTGNWVDFSMGSYRRALVRPLSETFIHPLSVFAHPWMAVVTGMLVTAIVFVPIAVAVLYRMAIATLFVLAVALIGHAPVLAAFLGIGCLLAGRTRVRRSFPFLAVLLGLAPVGAYVALFSHGPEMLLSPLQWFVLYMLLILTLVTSMLAGALVLVLARVGRFRPGVIWPVLLVLLVAPVWLFHREVGPAELDYALIVHPLARSDAIFRSQTLEDFFLSGSSDAAAARSPEAALAAVEKDLLRRQRRMVERCDRFLRDYPTSERGPAVMLLRATVKDVRLDLQAFREGLIKYRSHSPSKVSLGAWRELAQRYPGSPQAMVAHQRLGIAALRDGRVAGALENLHIAKSLLMTHLGPQGAPVTGSIWAEVFRPQECWPGEKYYREALAETDKIIWLTNENKLIEGDQANVNAFADYMKLWPFEQLSAEKMAGLAASSPGTELADNLALLQAMAETDDLRRAEQLSALCEGLKDAAIIAHYELGRLALRYDKTPSWDVHQLKSAEHYFNVVRQARENPYKASAERHLAWLAVKAGSSR